MLIVQLARARIGPEGRFRDDALVEVTHVGLDACGAVYDFCGADHAQRLHNRRPLFRKGFAVAEVDLCHPRCCRDQLLKPMCGFVVAEVDLCHPGRGRGWRWQSSTSATQEVAEVNF